MAAERREVRWSALAESDLNEICAFIARERPQAAADVVEDICDRVESLSRFPDRGHVVPELRRLGPATCREISVAPWRVVYQLEDSRILILAVLDGRRDLEDLLLRRLAR
jgi:plasmid stabilization system protein ParE